MNTGFTPPHYFLTKQSFINGGLVEHKTHLGIASCKLIKHYVETYKCLKEVSIVLKLFLSTYKLNSPYHGKSLFINYIYLNRRSVIVLDCASLGCIYEQMEFENESIFDTL